MFGDNKNSYFLQLNFDEKISEPSQKNSKSKFQCCKLEHNFFTRENRRFNLSFSTSYREKKFTSFQKKESK